MTKTVRHNRIIFGALVLAIVAVIACATSATDNAATILKIADDGYKAASAAHDARVGSEPADVHAKHRVILVDFRKGLTAAWAVVIDAKQINADPAPGAVYAAIKPTVGPFLELAVQLGAMKQSDADRVSAAITAVLG